VQANELSARRLEILKAPHRMPKGLVTVTTTTEVATRAAVATSSGAIFPRPGDIDGQIPTVEGCSVKCLDCFLGFLRGAHGDEAKAPRAAAHAVDHEVGFNDSTVGGEGVLEVVFGGVEGEVPNEQFRAHVMRIVPRPSVLSPNRSRPPGFKSSLNRVQLKIHHVLEATSALTDPRKMPVFYRLASRFFEK
jgi:hypothetical protein